MHEFEINESTVATLNTQNNRIAIKQQSGVSFNIIYLHLNELVNLVDKIS